MATAKDPICQMDVDTDNPSGGQSEHEGAIYYFCAPGCKVAFDKEPRKYVSQVAGESESGGHDHGHSHMAHHMPENTPEDRPLARKPGFFARLFGKK